MTLPSPEPAVALQAITKRFPGVLANDAVDLHVSTGEIHALMGENGAGKSTLMSVLYGLYRPDAGTITLHGQEVSFASPAQAIDAGIGMVQQGFALFGELTVAENVIFGREPTRRGLIDRKATHRHVAELIDRHELRLRPTDRLRDLPVGARQQVEILKLLYRDARVLILDEPTAVLTPGETDRLFTVLRELAATERTILFVSHKLHEVLAVSDAVTVLRAGRVAMTARTEDTTKPALATAMTGRAVDLDRRYPGGTPGEPILHVSNLSVPGAGKPLLDNVSLTVRAGEIVGIAGVAGNGQSELVAAIAGLAASSAASGQVWLRGKEITHLPVAKRRAAGIAHIPEDRAEVGSAPSARLEHNLAVGFQRRLARRGLLRPSAIKSHAEKIVQEFDIRTSGSSVTLRTLSGGNQQKAILGRELAHEAELLLVEQPTRGVDIGSIVTIHTRLATYRDAGHAILLVSAELSEILGLSDRILVMYEGRVVAEFSRAEADPDRIGLAMAGVVS